VFLLYDGNIDFVIRLIFKEDGSFNFHQMLRNSSRKCRITSFLIKGSAERLIYLTLKELNERLKVRKLMGFKEIESGNYHALPGEFFTQ